MSIRKTSEGTYRADFKRGISRVSRTFKRKKDAVAWLAEQATAHDGDRWTDPSRAKVPVGDLFEPWMRTRQVSGSTLATDRAIWRGQVQPRWESVQVGQVTTPAIRTWVAGSSASPATRKHALRVLRGVLGHAMEEGRIPRNPALGIRVVGAKQNRAGQALSPVELRAFCAALTPPWGGLALVLATTGLRGSELAGLDHGAVLQVEDRCYLRVDRRWVTDEGGKRTLLAGTKAGVDRSRTVPLVPEAAAVVLGLHRRGAQGPLFCAPSGQRLDWRNFRRASGWKAAAEAIGRPGLRTHDLRHTAATLLLRASGDIKAVQAVLGHATASVTLDIYGHALSDSADRAADALSQALGADRARIHYDDQPEPLASGSENPR